MNLKNCPFCGGEAYIVERRTFGPKSYHQVLCKECGAGSPFLHSRIKTIEAWNRRAIYQQYFSTETQLRAEAQREEARQWDEERGEAVIDE